MKNRNNRAEVAATALAALGTLLLTVCLALSAFNHLATDGEVYYRLQLDEGVEPGISDDEMHDLDILLADYLAGDARALDDSVFNQRERAHMVDVYDIFSALRRTSYICLVSGCLLFAAAMMPSGRRPRRARRGAAIGAALFFLPIAAIALWAALDFSSAFTAMHHALFTNDLWLLDPRTDIMIRMLPEGFFMALARRLILGTAIAAACGPALCAIAGAAMTRLTGDS